VTEQQNKDSLAVALSWLHSCLWRSFKRWDRIVFSAKQRFSCFCFEIISWNTITVLKLKKTCQGISAVTKFVHCFSRSCCRQWNAPTVNNCVQRGNCEANAFKSRNRSNEVEQIATYCYCTVKQRNRTAGFKVTRTRRFSKAWSLGNGGKQDGARGRLYGGWTGNWLRF